MPKPGFEWFGRSSNYSKSLFRKNFRKLNYEIEKQRFCHHSWVHDASRERVARQFGGGANSQLIHQAVAMEFDRLGRDAQRRGDLLGRFSFSHQLQHLALARRQMGAEHLGRVDAWIDADKLRRV